MSSLRGILVVAVVWAVLGAAAHAGLVAHWSLDEGSGTLAANSGTLGVAADGTLVDEDTGNGDGNSPPNWLTHPSLLPPVSGGTSAALLFDGTDDLVDTTWGGIGGTTSRTVTFWMAAPLWSETQADNESGIVAWGDSNSNGTKWHMRLNHDPNNGTEGALRTEVQGGYIIGSTEINDGRWHQVAAVFEGTNMTDTLLYVDGQLEAISGQSAQSINTTTTADPVSIGRRIQKGNLYYFPGAVDDVRIYDEALDAPAIAALFPGPGGPLPAIFQDAGVDTDGDDRWQDLIMFSGTDYDWQLSGAQRQTGVSALPGIAAAYDFDGSATAAFANGRVDNFPDDLSNDPASFEIWFKPDDLTGQEILVEFGGSTDGASLTLNDNLLQLIAADSGNEAGVTFDLSTVDTSEFVMAIGVIDLDTDEITLYVNDEAPVSAVSAGDMADWAGTNGDGLASRGGSQTGGDGGFFGALNGYNNFQGQIGLFRLYPTTLTQGEVTGIYNSVAASGEAAIPEPATLSLLGLGGLGLLFLHRRRRARGMR